MGNLPSKIVDLKSSLLEELESQTSDCPLERVVIHHKSGELTGLCLLGPMEGIKQFKKGILGLVDGLGLQAIVSGAGKAPGRPRRWRGALKSPAAGLPEKDQVSAVLREEMAKSGESRLPCAYLAISIKAAAVSDEREAVEFLRSGIAQDNFIGWLGKRGVGLYSFFIIVPGTGLNRARKITESLRKRVESSKESVGKLYAGLGVYYAGGAESVKQLMARAVKQLGRSEKKAGIICVVPGSARDTCQVTVEERTQLFGFRDYSA